MCNKCKCDKNKEEPDDKRRNVRDFTYVVIFLLSLIALNAVGVLLATTNWAAVGRWIVSN